MHSNLSATAHGKVSREGAMQERRLEAMVAMLDDKIHDGIEVVQ